MKPKKVIVPILLICFCITMNAQPFKEGYESGIILLSLNAVSHADISSSTDELFSLNKEDIEEDPLLEIQLNIAKKASEYNKVVILIPNEETYDYIENNYYLEYYTNIQTIILKHDAAWIRDYGPYFNIKDSVLNILDAKYHDSRYKNSIQSEVFGVNQKRESIVNNLMMYQQFRELSSEDMGLLLTLFGYNVSSKKIDKYSNELIKIINDEIESSLNDLKVYETYIDVLTDEFTQRFNDDQVPELLPEKLYDILSYEIETFNNFNMSGGNFLINNSCQCFTTTELLLENNNKKNHVEEILTKKYGCKEVIFLEPLPGENIIKHVDMFLLPIDSNNVFLASFCPTSDLLKDEWNTNNYNSFDNDINLYTEKELAIEAEIAMKKNKKILESKGFNVIDVPSYLPKQYSASSLHDETITFYPTILNCLVQVSDDNNTLQVLMPSYEDLSGELFDYSNELMKNEFIRAYGNEKEIIFESIECTKSAMAQGAIHCLTLTIPKLHSKYFDSFYMSEKAKIKDLLTE